MSVTLMRRGIGRRSTSPCSACWQQMFNDLRPKYDALALAQTLLDGRQFLAKAVLTLLGGA
ncbi:MAG: hypothetical protein ABL982_23705 [Vicinamibacterales bacterium]